MEKLFSLAPEVTLSAEERSEGKLPSIQGYAAVFYQPGERGTEYELWEGARERIMPGAFDRSLAEADDVQALFNHDPNMVLGRSKAGTLKLDVFAKGLRYTIKPGNTTVARDVVEHIQRGDVTGSSFGFTVTDQDWRKEDGAEIREVRGVRLVDVGPVLRPAYGDATTGLRAAGDAHEARSSYDQWKAKQELDAKLASYRERAASLAG